MTVDSAVPYISVSCLSEAALKVRNIVGEALWDRIVEAVGGSTLYVPLECNYYERRNREIALFAGHHTISETALRFRLSSRQIKRILGR